MDLTNRNLEKAFSLSLNHVKKQAVLCLGRDPEADQAKGVLRKYSLDDAFIIYLYGAVLIKNFRMGLKEAKIHIDNIKPVLLSDNLLPSKIDTKYINPESWHIPNELITKANTFINLSIDKIRPSLLPGIDLTILPGNNYLLEKYIRIYYLNTVNNNNESITFAITKSFPNKFASLKPGPHYYISVVMEIINFKGLISKVI
ncbi:MAG: hypothetical protein ACYDEQ_02140 [Desulfocucumaceae bacterium]